MIGPLPYQKRHEYPHLSKREAQIWEKYIESFPERFEDVCYDVELGIPRNFDENRPAEYRDHHRYLGGYKIDVLGRKGDLWTIIELKKAATTKAMGEVWLYEILFKNHKMPGARCELEIVTDEEMPHIREVCEADGVKLTVLAVPTPGLPIQESLPKILSSEVQS